VITEWFQVDLVFVDANGGLGTLLLVMGLDLQSPTGTTYISVPTMIKSGKANLVHNAYQFDMATLTTASGHTAYLGHPERVSHAHFFRLPIVKKSPAVRAELQASQHNREKIVTGYMRRVRQ
jgi:hypothetical protein